MDVDDLTVQTVRDGAVCTLILGGALDLLAAGEFLQHAARVLDDRIERLVLDLAGVTFLDCAGVRALAIATCFAPGGCPVIIRSLSSPARRIITALGTDDIENLRRLSAGLEPQNGRRDGVTSDHELVPVTWGDLDLDALSVHLDLLKARREANVHPHRYRIFIGGGPSTAICEAFEGFTIASDGAYTTLVADLDQAALYGALLRIQALDLDLIELTRTSETQADRRRRREACPMAMSGTIPVTGRA